MTRTNSAAPRVSVVIPVFNDEGGLYTCLDSIERQSYPLSAIEVLVVDNGSSPPIAIKRTYSFELRTLRCEKPGSYAARNFGAAHHGGEYLAFIDADCWAHQDWLREAVRCHSGHGGSAVVGGDVLISRPDIPSAVALYQCATGFGQKANVRDRQFAATANLFCSASQFIMTGPFDERLLSGGDREWCWRAVKRGLRVEFCPSAIVHTRPRSDLSGAIRQARRVAAGRRTVTRLGLAHLGQDGLSRPRSAGQSVLWILRHRELGVADRLRVLSVAMLIRAAATIESLRLALGSPAERR